MFLVSSCSCLCPIHWSQVLNWERRCSWSSADRRCSNFIWVLKNYIAYWGATYIRGFTVASLWDTMLGPILPPYCFCIPPMSAHIHMWTHEDLGVDPLWQSGTNVLNSTTLGGLFQYTVYRQVSYIRSTLVGDKIVDHSDVDGASPVGAAPITSSFST